MKSDWATADEVRDLLGRHGLRNMRGYATVARWLYVKPNSVQMMLSRGTLRAYYDYLRLRLKDKQGIVRDS